MLTNTFAEKSLLSRKMQMISLKKLPKKPTNYENLPLQKAREINVDGVISNSFSKLKQSVKISVVQSNENINDNYSTAKNISKKTPSLKIKTLEKNLKNKAINFIDIESNSQKDLCLNSIRNINKSINQQKTDHYFDDCCVRLFTFMGSTQKYKVNDQTKNEKLLNEQESLVNFIQSSRKKRQEFLSQLKKLEENQSDDEKSKIKMQMKIINIDSTKNTLGLSMKNKAQSTKLNKSIPTKSRSYTPQHRNLHQKADYFKASRKISSHLKLNALNPNNLNQMDQKQKSTLKQSSSRGSIWRKSLNKNTPINSKSKNILTSVNKNAKLSTASLQKAQAGSRTQRPKSHLSQISKQNANIEKLMKKKKQLQNKLTNLNGQILMFNKRKPNHRK